MHTSGSGLEQGWQSGLGIGQWRRKLSARTRMRDPMIAITERTDARRARRGGTDVVLPRDPDVDALPNDVSVHRARANASKRRSRAVIGLSTSNERLEATAWYKAERRTRDAARAAHTRGVVCRDPRGAHRIMARSAVEPIAQRGEQPPPSAARRSPACGAQETAPTQGADTARRSKRPQRDVRSTAESHPHRAVCAKLSRPQMHPARLSVGECDEAIRTHKQTLALTPLDRIGIPGGRITRWRRIGLVEYSFKRGSRCTSAWTRVSGRGATPIGSESESAARDARRSAAHRSVPTTTIKLAKPRQPLDGPCDTEADTAVTKQTKVTPG